MLQTLLPFQKIILPGLASFTLWSSYRTVFKGDRAVGLVLYMGLVIIVDSFLNTGIPVPGLEYGSVRYSEICALFLIVQNPSVERRKATGILLLLISAYFILFLYAGLRGETIRDGIDNFRRFIIPQITAFLAAYRGFEKEEDYDRFSFYLMFLVILIALFTFWDLFFDRWILHSQSLYTSTYSGGRQTGRFGSFFLNPNFMGAFAVLIFPLIFIRALMEKKVIKKIICWAGVLAVLFSLIETQSRGPMLGFLVAVLSFAFIPADKYSAVKRLISLILLVIIFYIAIPGFYERATERFQYAESEASEDSKSRMSVWLYTIKIIKDHALKGIGLGEVRYISTMYRYGFSEEYLDSPLDNAHNSYLQIAVHTGLPALVIFILINAMLLGKALILLFRSGTSEVVLYLLGLTAGVMGFLTCLLLDMHMFVQSLAPCYWALLGITCSLTYYHREPVQ